ncbi:MAG: carbohydrate binding family 9 domain-containing protein [Acidobacteria bacterium]|nr:carbohydrate binding family 9 domain-containing protein [Acidobacteriota bacterium]
MHPSPRRGRRVALPTAVLLAAALALPVPAAAQRAGLGIDLLATIDGPPPPEPPAVLARDEAGRVTGRAVRLETPLDIDGRLDEEIYATVPAMSDFVQVEPQAGAPATEKTEIWIFYDDANVYFVARCWESEPGRLTVDEMRRDNNNIGRNDNVSWFFDTLYDRRTGLVFEVNPLGGRMDGQSLNEARTNFDWNPIWDLEVGRFEHGWTVESALPFKSIRYRPGTAQLWGFNARRRNKWKNELSYLIPIPPAVGGRGLRAPLAAPLVGIETPPLRRNLEFKPYGIADVTSDAAASPPISNALAGTGGLDVKYEVTRSLAADFTLNTDFAQVEADEEQVNLTRFSLFFPEKREFFLENQGTFAFGGTGGYRDSGDTPILFYSRRIGLEDGRQVPVQAGGRMTGRVGGFDVGMLHIRTGEEDVAQARPTGFSVVRLKRDVFRQSSVGVLLTQRSLSVANPGGNTAVGVDGSFRFLSNAMAIDAYWAGTRSEELPGTASSYRANFEFDGDRYGLRAEHLMVGDAFNPEVGFVRRPDMRKSAGELRFSPRLWSVPAIRKLRWRARIEYIENLGGRLETRESDVQFAIEMENSDRFFVRYRSNFEFLPEPFDIAPDVILPVGGYDFGSVRAGYNFGSQRRVALNVRVEHGTFYSGNRTVLRFNRSRARITPKFAVEPSWESNWIDLAEGKFTTQLIGSRIIHTAPPKMFTSALLQYNSASNTVAANVRFRWEYQPGSELFVVYNEQRDTLMRRFPGLENRAFIVKLTRLFRM